MRSSFRAFLFLALVMSLLLPAGLIAQAAETGAPIVSSLIAGDIAVIGYNADDPDAFAFVLLTNVSAGTEINFSDNGWLAAGAFRTGEGTATWAAETDLCAGTVVAPGTGTILFSTSGDQVFAYQGTNSSPSFVYALNNEGAGVWQADATSSNTSALPPGLVNGATAVALDEIDNAVFNGITTGTRADLLAAISNKANWLRNDTTRFTMPSAPFVVTDAPACGGSDIAPTVASTTPASNAIDIPVASDIVVEFSEPVTTGGAWYDISCTLSGAHTATVAGGPTSFTLNPDADFAKGETCTITIYAARVADQDGTPDAMVADHAWSFDTVTLPPCEQSFTPIYAIQGSGPNAAITGVVTTQGIVVGDYEGAAPALRGYYLQDLTGDGDAATSDGIFVFNGSFNNVNVGDVVRVTGNVTEFQGQTQISANAAPVNCGAGVIAPVEVTLPFPTATFAEQYEGMLVRLPQTLYVTEHFQLGRFGQVVLSSGGRLMQPTNIYAPGVDASALQAANNLNRIILDDALNNQNPDPILFARGGLPLSASNTLRGGDTATGIVGVMTYTWAGASASGNAYRVRPINALGSSVYFEAANPRPESAPALAGSLRVAGMNLLNFFNTFDGLPDSADNCALGVGGGPTDCRGADTLTEFGRQWPKTVAAIVGTNADIVGLVEVENDGYGPDSALQFLVDRLNDATAPGTFAFIDVDAGTGQLNALGTDAIKVGLIYKPARAMPVGSTAALNTVDFVNGGDSAPRNRPALAQAFEEVGTGARVVVAVNHLKSKGSACDTPDAGDGQGECNVVRTNAANLLWSWLAADPTQTGDADALVVGDLNSYAMEDPITALKNAGYTNLKSYFGGWDAYSYVFDGQWGYLDHALSSATLTTQVASVADWHINADEPSVLDYNTDFKTANLQSILYAPDMFRIADHDPVLVDLNLTPETNLKFVTGGGWFNSPAGAYTADPGFTGKSHFNINAQYQPGELTPQGHTSLTLQKTDFDFQSTAYQWLVVSADGATAQYKGVGEVNGVACEFMVWVVDGEPDQLRIKIWNESGILYDNAALQPINNGSLQIHTR